MEEPIKYQIYDSQIKPGTMEEPIKCQIHDPQIKPGAMEEPIKCQIYDSQIKPDTMQEYLSFISPHGLLIKEENHVCILNTRTAVLYTQNE